MLKAGDWKKADQETYRVMIRAVGKEEGQWFTSEELLNFPCTDFKTIDCLWVKYSNGKFGFSVQKQIYLECGGKPDGKYPGDKIWNEFGDRVGWRRSKEWVSYSDFIFDDTKALPGHLPWLVCAELSGGGLFSRIETCKV